MADVQNITTTIIDRKRGPDLFRNPHTADTPGFAAIGNSLGFGGGLFPNAGLQENRHDYEWEMGCYSWQNPPTSLTRTAAGDLLRIAKPKKAIKFRANPAEVSWSMPQRSQEQKTKAGTVLHVWNDRDRKTYFNEPVITITFQSGNILPVTSIEDPTGNNPALPDGLNNFYEFMALVDEVKVLGDGRANLCYIDYNSLIFPRIRLWGFFNPNGISFVDQSSNPAQVNTWTASFTVYRSVPELGRAIATFNDSITDGSLAGTQLKKVFDHAGSPYINRRSETFGVLRDAATTAFAIASGQIAPRDVAAATNATINAASQRIVTTSATALAGAVATTAAGGALVSRLGATVNQAKAAATAALNF
jgi:hypothetical protein